VAYIKPNAAAVKEKNKFRDLSAFDYAPENLNNLGNLGFFSALLPVDSTAPLIDTGGKNNTG
jgi:hypothetical protein